MNYNASRAALYTPEHAESILLTQSLTNPIAFAIEAARLAYYRAEESTTESPEQLDRLTMALGKAGWSNIKLFVEHSTGSFAFGATHTDGRALLSFRGTQPDDIADIRTDITALLVDWSTWPHGQSGRVHRGFAKAYESLHPQIHAWLANKKDLKLTITGHSLGGALATIAACIYKPASLVTLGCPRVGDATFCANLNDINYTRLVDCCDLVTCVPPAGLFGGYQHPNNPTYINRAGKIVTDLTDDQVPTNPIADSWDYFRRYGWRFITHVFHRSFADHAPVNYLRAYV